MSRSSAESARLTSVDALRGVAALGVALYHATDGGRYWQRSAALSWIEKPVLLLCSYGYVGVFLFFVISGFCIHMRAAKAEAAGRPPDLDFFAFWKRRIRRLYPPYLIALVIYVVVLVARGKLQVGHFLLYNIGMHLVMLHNFDMRIVYSICGPFWTLAIEEQLYLAYFLLVPLRRWLGWKKTLAICLAVRLAWFALSFAGHRFFSVLIPAHEAAASNWFIWALGAMSVEAALGMVKLPAWSRDLRIGLPVLVLAALLARASDLSSATGLKHHLLWLVTSPVWGVGFFIVINRGVALEREWRLGARVPLLVGAAAAVGIFSYSLYLTHELILDLLAGPVARLVGTNGWVSTYAALLLLTPACLFLSWLFFYFFERPFLSRPVALPVTATPPQPSGAA
jgi:peptidoglycan/LPS O-acetylase OafA/YrhL